MRSVDEFEEKRVQLQKRKRKILVVTALGLIGLSLFGWWRKALPPEPVVMSRRPEVEESVSQFQRECVVYVSGWVKNPGVVKLQPGTRAIDAVNAAGGIVPGADLAKINLAKMLRDGMQVHVPGRPPLHSEEPAPPYRREPADREPAAQKVGALGNTKININTADITQLNKLPGVGPAMAVKIIEWRQDNGAFQVGEDLKKVKGFGEARYQKIKDRISW